MLFATTRELLESTVDMIDEPGISLADNPEFEAARDRVEDSRFAFLYTNTENIVDSIVSGLVENDQSTIEAIEDNTPKFLSASASAIDQGIKISTSFTTPKDAQFVTGSNSTEAANYLPGDTLALISTGGVQQLWNEFKEQIDLGQSAELTDGGPAIGRYHQGRTLHLNVMSMDRVAELRYSTIDPQQVVRHWHLPPSAGDLELVLLRLKVENHTAVSTIVNIDRAAAEMRDFSNGSYFPLAISESVYQDLRGEPDARIRMNLGQCFDPNRLVVDTGTELKWTNEGDVQHFVEFDGAEVPLGGTGRGEIAPSGSISHNFGRAGVFDYNCGTADTPPQAAQVLVVDKGSGPDVRERSVLFLEGSFELPRNTGIDGWMVFEVPKGTQIRDLRWRAGDSITVSLSSDNSTFKRVLQDFNDEFGLDIERDIVRWITGEVAIALLPTNFAKDVPVLHALALAEFNDSEATETALENIVDSLEGQGLDIDQFKLGDLQAVTVDIETNGLGGVEYEPGYFVLSNYVVFGTTRESLRRSAKSNAGEIESLSQNSGYRRALSEIDGQLDYLIFASVRGIVNAYLDAVSPSDRADYRDNVAPYLDPIDAILIGGSSTEELTTFNLILTFD